jgi:ribosomal protein L16 Arg81 hydroxylase
MIHTVPEQYGSDQNCSRTTWKWFILFRNIQQWFILFQNNMAVIKIVPEQNGSDLYCSGTYNSDSDYSRTTWNWSILFRNIQQWFILFQNNMALIKIVPEQNGSDLYCSGTYNSDSDYSRTTWNWSILFRNIQQWFILFRNIQNNTL